MDCDREKTGRSYRRVGIFGAILFLVSVLYIFLWPGTSATLMHFAMQLGFVASYVLLVVSVAGVARAGPASVFIALISNGYVLVSALQFFWVPQGASIRPMGWAAFVCLISLVCFIIVVALSIQGVRKNRTYGWAFLALPLGMLPPFVGGGVLQFAAWLNGFTQSP